MADDDLCLHVLNGLGPEYAAFIISISTRGIPKTYNDLQGMLLTQEISIMVDNLFVDVYNPSAHYTTSNDSHGGLYPRGGSGNHGRNAPPRFYHTTTPPGSYSGNGSHSGHSSSNALDYCQICNRIGHKALDCRQRFNHAYSSGFTPNPSTHYLE
ncbi:hypothetical protein NE237_011536 [Protea cynaroides]|uniref:CCHC-type domain-containing protein n=1 Tax=Protea cynaroides TaxID=273540 RepID=A0A9Q0JYC7_9MAGN|nr:hypothetical protein NE237_011536 [Protea cynaroides]